MCATQPHDTLLAHSEGVISVEAAHRDEVLVLGRNDDVPHSLGGTARDVWHFLETPHTEHDVLQFIAETYEITYGQARDGVSPFLALLLEHGLLLPQTQEN